MIGSTCFRKEGEHIREDGVEVSKQKGMAYREFEECGNSLEG